MPSLDGTTVVFVFHRIPLDTDFKSGVCASSDLGGKPSPSTPVVTISVFHERISGSAEDGDLKTAAPCFFEVTYAETRRCFTSGSEAILSVVDVLRLEDAEIKDLTYMVSFTTTKKHHTNNAHLTSFKLNSRHWEWEYETAGEVQITPNAGDGILAHATVWNESSLALSEPPETSVLGEAELDPADEDEFGGIRHRKRIPDERDDK